ncbi:MAG: hypothetical protein AB2614_03325 [Candidatus Thiodiazotropha endolucinida]|nr:hypothetical protein [Candidatus Thiodiazotropha taylori]MCW4226892.1 hypothetical protein [Candidatus Thiodiazotropha endolucinida]MCG7881138.1 hypothetical protein [Candidatus Thiodiazotropha taylori]MCG7888454.1 hypothetical protein [Candidatus Thiodiazotropha taylori]MCG7889370.1 hypothetical protein [Candidatus Thiodiazotropha taylori]
MNIIKLMTIGFTIIFTVSISVADEEGSVSGTVAEVIDVGNYTYIQLSEQGTWIATSHLLVDVGDKIEYRGGIEMRDFYSKALDRKFDSVIFVQAAKQVDESVESSRHQTLKGEGHGNENRQTQRLTTVQVPIPGEISQLADGKTIADIMADATQLNEQSVSLRARVIKVSPNIMGKNWITLQDGTGTPPNDKLIATSTEQVMPGELVIASGVIRYNVDIGSGYTYKVLLEQTKFSLK